MTHRILLPDEWAKLAHTDLGRQLPLCDPAHTLVLVVEDGDEIVGCWAALTIVHVEGLWVDPTHRKRVSVQRHLWTGMQQLLRGQRSVLTGAADMSVQQLIEAHGGQMCPPFFCLPLVKES